MNRHKPLYTLANINIKEVNFRRNFNEQSLGKEFFENFGCCG
jgi:hypothetical protein